MKKTTLILLFAFATLPCAIAQGPMAGDVVFFGQSKLSDGKQSGIIDGFWRHHLDVDRFNKLIDDPKLVFEDATSFRIGSTSLNCYIWLCHDEIRNSKHNMAVVNMPIMQFNSIKSEIINVDGIFDGKTKEDIWRLSLDIYFRYKPIWVIDKSLYYKSDDSLAEPDMMKILQVRIETGIIPDAYQFEYAHGKE